MKLLEKVYAKISNWTVSIGKSVVSYAEAMGRAKAAAELSRAGYHKEAKDLLLKD